ncbi:MAG TPA: preprotein translocase subunit SecE [Clostridiaceae bacterium]|nr:preprotein translocase subunit SecE [Clostridiaceae bacterium]
MSENTKVSKLANTRKRFVRFAKDIKNELKKVIWPTRKQLVNNTITVLFVCLVIGIIIWVLDFGLAKLVEAVLLR